MDAAGAAGGEPFVNYAAEILVILNSLGLEGPSAQDRIDIIVPDLISLLPPPFVPATDDDGSSDSDDDHFSLTSSDSDDSGGAAGADWPAAQDDGQDHIGRLADDLLSNIVSRLPTNEAARTMVLSTRWRFVWAATPLLVDDAHLRAANESHEMSAFRAVRAVSRCVAAHPGPLRAVRITHLSFHQQEYALQRLVAALAAKNVQDLILFNRPWSLDMPLPDDILSCAYLTRLYGIWRWPFLDTTAHPPAFPNLQELGLFHTIIEDKGVDALLAQCPKLKIFSFVMACNSPSRLRVKSRSLRVVVEWRCSFVEVIIDDAPCLERLLLESSGDRRTIKIVHAPRLEILGFLDLQLHTLEIGGIAIRAGMNVRACAMLPSVKILAVKVRFWDDMEAKMLTTLLRCFPQLETLHIMCIRSRSPDTVDDMDFWKSLASCDCLDSHLKTFVIHGVQGRKHEARFTAHIFKNGKVLKSYGIVYSHSDYVAEDGSDGSSSSDDVVDDGSDGSSSSDVVEDGSDGSSSSDDAVEDGSDGSSSNDDVVEDGSDGSSSSDDVIVEEGPTSGSVGEGNAPSGGSSGSDDAEVERRPMSGTVGEGNAPSGGSSGKYVFAHPAFPCWSFQNAINLSVEDPFYVLGPVMARIDIVGGETTR